MLLSGNGGCNPPSGPNANPELGAISEKRNPANAPTSNAISGPVAGDAASTLSRPASVLNMDSDSVFPEPTADLQTHLTAAQVWQSMLARYAQVDAYQDRAEVNLQYRLDGQLVIESQPMQLCFDRAGQRWKAQAFRANVQADADVAAMSILEIATNHLDHQVKWMAVNQDHADGVGRKAWFPIDMFRDPIAQVYLSGATDFPLQENTAAWPSLFCPQLALLLANSSLGPAWLRPATLEFAGTTFFRGSDCVVLQGRPNVGASDASSTQFWVEQNTLTLRRVILPSHNLDPRLTGSVGLSDLQLFIDFADVQLGTIPPDLLPHILVHADQKVVRNFVPVPEAFPSPWIGRPSPEFNLPAAGDQNWQLTQFLGRPVAAVFIPVQRPETALPQPSPTVMADQASFAQGSSLDQWQRSLEQVAAAAKNTTAEIVLAPVVPPPSRAAWITRLNQSRLRSGAARILLDAFPAWEQLHLGQQPTLVIWDGHGVIQYVDQVQAEQVGTTIESLLQRLDAGQSIALEMTDSYRGFFAKYLSALQQETIAQVPPAYQAPSQQSSRSAANFLPVSSVTSQVPALSPDSKSNAATNSTVLPVSTPAATFRPAGGNATSGSIATSGDQWEPQAIDLAPWETAPAADSATSDQPPVARSRSTASDLRPALPSSKNYDLHWVQRLTLPLAMAWVDFPEGSQLWVLDGFRTLEKFSSSGDRLASVALQLPENVGISRLLIQRLDSRDDKTRSNPSQDDLQIFGFNPGADLVYSFASDGRLLKKIQVPANAGVITDVQCSLLEGAFGRKPILLIATTSSQRGGRADSGVAAFDLTGDADHLDQPIWTWPLTGVRSLVVASQIELAASERWIGMALTAEGDHVALLPSGGVRMIATAEHLQSQGRTLTQILPRSFDNDQEFQPWWAYQQPDAWGVLKYANDSRDARPQNVIAPHSWQQVAPLQVGLPLQFASGASHNGGEILSFQANHLVIVRDTAAAPEHLPFDSTILALAHAKPSAASAQDGPQYPHRPAGFAITTKQGTVAVYRSK